MARPTPTHTAANRGFRAGSPACRGRSGSRRDNLPVFRRFAEEFAASGLEAADLAAFAAAWRARVTAPAP
ncbi:MAG TPA: hypothetical protein VG123_24820 [Streptosporangiaceae bacterium]|nr:hypothetical protein [Streptosporangiaceae bacterium]